MNGKYVWIDCEMTGLNVWQDSVIEIAVIVTDEQLNIIAEGPNLIIHRPQEVMDAMNDWCKQHHGQSGLTEAVLKSTISTAEAQTIVLDFVQQHIPAKQGILAGNSVHMDKFFLMKEMPELIDYLHYRIVDVSTIKELTRAWYPHLLDQVPAKKEAHRALDDIKESIEELKFYKSKVFLPGMPQ